MRFWVVGVFAAGMAASGYAYAEGAGTTAPWTWTLDTSAQFVSWSGNAGYPTNNAASSHGAQFYQPFGVSVSGTPYENWNLQAATRGGYVYGTQTNGPYSGSVWTQTDTTLSGTATYTGFAGWQPFGSVATNLPTGRSLLDNAATWARMDPDLVPIAIYGEGFNITPTFGINILVNSEFTVVVSGAETWRGSYWKEGGFNPTTLTTMAPVDIKPSDITTGTVAATWQHDKWTLQGSAAYAVETLNYNDGMPAYRSGPRTTLSGSASYMWDQWWTTAVDGYFVHIDRNTIPNGAFLGIPGGALMVEPLDSNNNIFRINVSQMYKTALFGGTVTVGPVGSFMYRENNSYDSTTAQFIPAKQRYSIGASGSYMPNDKLNFTARLEHVWIHESQDPGQFPPIPAVDDGAWLASASITYTP